MNLFLDETKCSNNLKPLSNTRHVSDISIGILTIKEKWAFLLKDSDRILLSDVGLNHSISIPANIIPTKENFQYLLDTAKAGSPIIEQEHIKFIHYPWDIFLLNDWALRKDFESLTTGRKSFPINAFNFCINEKDIFIEEGAEVLNSSLNATTGPIYIGKNAKIMEGSLIRGPFSISENGVVKMGTKIYGATSIGKGCVAGGEIKNSILFENSNKAHDGYLGDSVIGAWCNLGAGTSASNVKNSAANITYQIENSGRSVSVGNKAGLIMGDYSRCAINTSFNTGTIVGTGCNIFETGFPPKNVRNFSWGKERYRLEKLLTDISNWKKMKGHSLSENEINKLTLLYSTEK